MDIGDRSKVDSQTRPHREGFDGVKVDTGYARGRFAGQPRRVIVGDIIGLPI